MGCCVMHGTIPGNLGPAIKASGIYASNEIASGKSASDDEDWFAKAAQALLSKPGLELHLTTGVDESLCYRYARGAVKVTGWIVRRLLRSKQGRVWLGAFMEGCDAPWWLEFQRAERNAAKLASLNLE